MLLPTDPSGHALAVGPAHQETRGGSCYDFNGAFARLLTHTFLDVTYLDARAFKTDGALGIHFDGPVQTVLVAGMSKAWLAVVGFGNLFIEPLRFADVGE